jgi:drug/metabolite transporter (DMT)-like permease
VSKPRWERRRDRWRLLFVAVWPTIMVLGFVLDVPTAELVVGLVTSGLAGCFAGFLVFSERGRRRLDRERYYPEILTVRNFLGPGLVSTLAYVTITTAAEELHVTRWASIAVGAPAFALLYGFGVRLIARGERERQEAIVSNSAFRDRT